VETARECDYADGMISQVASTVMLALILMTIAVIDWRRQIIPDVWNLMLAGSGLIIAALSPRGELASALIGAAVAFAVALALRATYAAIRGRQGLGLGDVKFLAASGAWVGAIGLPFLVLFAAMSGLALAIGLHVSGRPISAASRIPFGPHLAVGLFLTWILKPAGLL
jgi:leader peptidase (prepilin peptidase)/N-methyltransferase